MSPRVDAQKAPDTTSSARRDQLPEEQRVARAKKRPGSLNRSAVWSIRVAAIALIVGAWELSASAGWVNEIFTSKPSEVVVAIWDLLPDEQIRRDALVTVTEVLVGFLISAVAGILVGLLLGSVRVLAVALQPVLNGLNAVPRIALIPLFVAWFGLGMTPRIVLAFTIAFFIMVTTVVAALAHPDKDLSLLAKSLGASRRQNMMKFVLPGSTLVIASGLELSLIYSFPGVIAAEIVSGSEGLGTRMTYFANSFQADKFFAVLVLLTIISTVLTGLIRGAERRLLTWHQYEATGH
jgi:NitT/TauT family transport system permease protein